MATYQHALQTGARIDSYEIKNVLGVGGFGITYKAYDHTLQCDVAVKEYLPSIFAVRTPDGVTVTPKSERDEESYEYGLKRFLDEARTLAKFREPNIVRVVRFLEANHTAYLIMDYEDGEPLGARLKREMSLDEATVIAIMTPILESLRAVHAKDYLHRDIKPSNIYLRRDGSPVLLDFGSARQALEQQRRALTGVVTPGYAPLEQYAGDAKQGAWTDIYAIGATIYHCATGVAPVIATERAAALQSGEPDPISHMREFLDDKYSGAFLDAMERMLALAIQERPRDADEALAVLRRCEPGKGGGARAQRPAGAPGGWPPETLSAIEASLQNYIGPIAKVFIKKAAARSNDVEELTRVLSTFLTTERDKTEFLANTRQLSGRTDPSAGEATTSPAPSRRETKAPRLMTNLTAEELKRAEERLAGYVGPLSRVLVKKFAAQAKDRDELYRLLAQEIPNQKDRSVFLARKDH